MTEGSKKEVLIIGHKNPDTDSICSAIAYANLKNKIGDRKYVPMRNGKINGETKFVLDKFKISYPDCILDVGSQVSDIDIKKIDGIQQNISLKKAWAIMKEKNAATLAVTENNKLQGIISVRDIATSDMDIYDNRILSKAKTQYSNIVETLDGTMLVGDENKYVTNGKVLIAAANPDMLESFIEDDDIVLLGNRFEAQICAIEMNASCIIVCMNAPVTTTIKKLAAENGCTVISTPHDTYTVARLINQSMPVKYFMTSENLTTFRTDDFTADVKASMAKVRYRDFPVVDKNGDYCGMISRRSLLGLDKKKVILVDHNEKSQAVDGLEDAEILEIIDHHRIGSIQTLDPVFFRNQPLGCTATIVYQMFKENNITIEPEIAGILCSAIISDTLMYRSPTCTSIDKVVSEELAKIAGIDVQKHAEEMFEAGSDLKDKTPEEIFYIDYKNFESNGVKFGVGQISSMNSGELKNIESMLKKYVNEKFDNMGVDIILFMLTNILSESSNVIYFGSKAEQTVKRAFEKETENGSIYLEGVVSRKKQFVPAVMTALQ